MTEIQQMIEELTTSIQKKIRDIPDKRDRKKLSRILNLALDNKISKEDIKKMANNIKK